ncbi:hypothetical protein Ccrd_006400 [Cynara cardunculus var. scolymus]|uniref:Uncharacterized protein n=1 Tax=Cynara cardunculus var. scolymus TaxID=59895 RepID=A0A118JUI1_CYNCS|nr:hypothetical protein Ccrd_006400 [Cynara cardunculus var. scolymus]
MAGVHRAAAVAIPSSSVTPTTSASPIPGKSFVLVSSLSSSFPSRRRRTNHLRQKILKTLENKPYPDPSNPDFPRKLPTTSIDETVQQQLAEADQLSVSETTGFVDGIVAQFSPRSFVKIGFFLVGAFILQTICAVMIFGSNDLEGEDGNLNGDDFKQPRVLDRTNESKSNSLLSKNRNLIETKDGGMVLVDESEMDNKITEIKEMAREARNLEAKKKGLVEEGDDDIDYDLIDKKLKEKEVDGRLMKLRKSLEGNYEKLPPKFPTKESDIRNNGEKGTSAAEEAFGSLMFKKKYKYKSPSIDSGDKPKGFHGEDHNVANGTLINGISSDNGVDISDSNEQIDVPNGEGSEIKVQKPIDESIPFSEPENKSVERSERAEPRVSKTESIAGSSKEPKYDKQAGRAAKYGKSSNLEARKPRGFGKESQSDNATSSKHNGSLKGKKGGNGKSAKHLGDMKSSTQTDFWWTSLPYAVLMQRGGDGEESEGLFTLRSTLETKSGLSHTVAFEDRGDATNFSYLLESFFEDLGDFSTSIIPIPTNELKEAIKSQIMKVVVVKKGQLQLYIGQPLTDVESALRKLIEENDRL